MSDSQQESPQVVEAINRLSLAMEQLQVRYDDSQRSNRQIRIALIIILILFGFASYQAFLPVINVVTQLPQNFPKLNPSKNLNTELLVNKRQQFMMSLAPKEYAQVKQFEQQHALISQYLAVNPDFNSGATVALFLSLMAQSMQIMPKLYEEMHSMKNEIQAMNEKMNALPVLATDINAMRAQMSALPVLTNEINDMNRHMYNISRDLDATMGTAGRLIPW